MRSNDCSLIRRLRARRRRSKNLHLIFTQTCRRPTSLIAYIHIRIRIRTRTRTRARTTRTDNQAEEAPQVSSIRLTRFQVPSQARPGDFRRLSCHYEMRGATLHAVKIFKDSKEVSVLHKSASPSRN